jgi:hypothetical protein
MDCGSLHLVLVPVPVRKEQSSRKVVKLHYSYIATCDFNTGFVLCFSSQALVTEPNKASDLYQHHIRRIRLLAKNTVFEPGHQTARAQMMANIRDCSRSKHVKSTPPRNLLLWTTYKRHIVLFNKIRYVPEYISDA